MTKGLVNVVLKVYIYGSSCLLFDHFVCSQENTAVKISMVPEQQSH